MAFEERISGVLLHVTSLPSEGGVGDFGPAAYKFIDFLAASKQQLWQVLPLSPTGYGSSPYSALSAFAGNASLISLQKLAEQGWIAREKLRALPGAEGPCDFAAAFQVKTPLIEEAAANFLDHATPADRERLQHFAEVNHTWLRDWAMFTVLRRRFGYKHWNEWPRDFARRDPQALQDLIHEHGRELAIEQVVQFFFNEQWMALKAYANERHIGIMGDVAIFVSYDSADVWTHPDVFELDADLRPTRVSGVPPDYFSATGQRWGNPLYKWDLMQHRGFPWWIARIRRGLELHDTIRLDHFRGFESFWSIPAEAETALDGEWVAAPGYALFHKLREELGDLPFVAEDLGLITPEVNSLREHFGMPGMRILQFGFERHGDHLYLPHRYITNTVTYTGTHDNNTTLGWWREDTSPSEREALQIYLGPVERDTDIVWTLIRAAAASVANTCVLPLQDILSLGAEARMNKPSAAEGNWTWRYHPDALQPEIARRLAELMEMTDRDGRHRAIEGPAGGSPTDDSHLRSLEGGSGR